MIYKRLALIMKSVGAIGKTRRNAQQGFAFRGIDDVMNELHNAFAENEVVILPFIEGYETQERPTKSGSMQTFIRAKIKFTFVTVDGSSVSTTIVGEAMDMGDKAMNKALSIALKYALLQMFLIPTEEMKDPDAVTPEETSSLGLALQEIGRAATKEALAAIYSKYTTLQADQRFMNALSEKKKLILNPIPQAV
jgi:hypothetical protein